MRLPNDDATNGWSAILPPRTPRPALLGDVQADWLVLGAGFAGLAAARRLAELRPHAHIVVVDAGTVGDNASGRNSGFAIDVPHNIGSSLEELRQAAHYQALLTAGMNDLELLVAQHRIDCQWRRAGKYHCAVSPAAERTLQHHVQELRALGAPHELLDRNALAARLGTRYFAAGLYTPGTVLLNPAALCRGLADALPANVSCTSTHPCSGWTCRAARWWRTRRRAVCVRRNCCWRPMALRSSWACLAAPGGGDVSAGHLWLADCATHARAAQPPGRA